MAIELDEIDKLAAKGFEGVTVRKDLIRTFKGQYPVPTYVAEFLLGVIARRLMNQRYGMACKL